MAKNKWFLLQLFGGEGGASAGGEGDGGGASSGANAPTGAQPVDAEQARLLELGVPADKIRKRSRTAKRAESGVVANAQSFIPDTQAQKDDASQNNVPTEEKTTEAPARMTWDEIMKDPEYNKEMRKTVESRLASERKAADILDKISPALELIARKHGLDPANMDYDALVKAVGDDDSYYEEKALQMGVPTEVAKDIEKAEREANQAKQTLEDKKMNDHILKIQKQGEELKKTFPSFDLDKEMENPAFVRMTHPNVGISVEDAYFTIHRKEIMAAGMQVTAQQTAEKLANSIQAGSRRPTENGTSGQSPSVTTFDYSKASREQREALKSKIYAAALRGEKVYPGSR